MFNFFLTSLFILTIFSNNLNADIVNKISIIGNNRVNTETIILFSGLKINDDVDPLDINKSIKSLYETNFFKDITATFENSHLIFQVLENPIIQNVIIDGIKKKPLQKLLLDQVSLKSSSPFIESFIKKDSDKIKNILQSVGYYFSTVEPNVRTNTNNTLDLTYSINMGKRSYVEEIFFLGDKKIKAGKLLNVIASEENKFWKILSNKKFLNKEQIELDKRLLISYYKNKGYFNVSVNNTTVNQKKDENFQLIFNINSGDKFFFNNFKINLPKDYNPIFFSNIENKLNENKGSLYSYKILEKTLDTLEKIAISENYEFVDAILMENIIDNNKIDVVINLSESKKVYISKIDITGNNVTIEDVIRNELILDEGDPLNNILLKKSINNIKSLGIFKNVDLKISDIADEPSLKLININVEEKPTGQVSLGAGIGSSGASTSFGVTENNFLGRGIELNSNISLSTDSVTGIFSFVNTNYNNSDKDLIFSIQSSETDRFKDYGYKTQKHGFSLGTRFEHLDDLFITPSINSYYENLETDSSSSNALKKQTGDYLDIGLGYILDFDKRDQLYRPSDGFRSRFSQDLPIISDSQTISNMYEFNSYFEYLPDLIGSASFYVKTANSLGNKDVRISDRIYLPSSKLRGFESGKVGPKDGADYVGGNYAASINLSSELPIFKSFENTGFKGFIDIANVWGIDYSSSIGDSSKIRSATGVSVDWFTPIGPLNFSLSQPILKKDSDKTESFRFNLGTTF